MKKFKQISAIVAIVLMIVLVILTLVFALLTYLGVGDFNNAWKACAWSIVVVPLFLYLMLMVQRIFNRNKE